MADRCRLCTSNDRDGLIEDLARGLWADVAGGPDGLEWERADYWRPIYRRMATAAVVQLERQHA